MASQILRRSLATSAASTVKIGLIPADGIGREGKFIFSKQIRNSRGRSLIPFHLSSYSCMCVDMSCQAKRKKK